MNHWDQRYSEKSFFYGEEPNAFFADFLKSIPENGKILLPAEGEGRNAVFAAKQGWEVDAFDSSRVARQKALDFAKTQNVEINYSLLDLSDFDAEAEKYDVAALIFVHVPPNIRKPFHQKILKTIKKGGNIFIESFAEEQINNSSGGPKSQEMLHSKKNLLADFPDIEIIKLSYEEETLNEGHHQGKANLIRLIGKKIV